MQGLEKRLGLDLGIRPEIKGLDLEKILESLGLKIRSPLWSRTATSRLHPCMPDA